MNDKREIKFLESINSFSKEDLEKWSNWIFDKNPFSSPSFYLSLEEAKLLNQDSGWIPLYIASYLNDKLESLVISFIKTHSYGEYIFDWQWAHAYDNYQIPYYPKLTIAAPYSPVSAPKLLGDQQVIKDFIIPQILSFTQGNNLSGVHFLFTSAQENQILSHHQLKVRSSLQYHWYRKEAESFDDYLNTLKKNRRKSIKKERKIIAESELKIQRKKGSELTEREVSFFYQCYQDTISKKMSMGYLNFEFFKSFIESFKDQVTLVLADLKETPIACSLFIQSEDTLYGRYWGCVQDIEFLHFELCIYQGIELAIENGLKVFEAGAQGEHKRMRGFTPVITSSAHYIDHPQFRKAIYEFIDAEEKQLKELQRELSVQNSLKAKV